MTARIEATLRAYAAAWGAHDREAWLDTFAASATQEDPIGDKVRRGRGEIGEFWDAAFSAYQTIELRTRNVFVAGGEAAMEWTIEATGAKGTTTFSGVDVFTFDEAGRIRSVRAYWERERV
jgi:steroid delta-isomerase